MTCPFLTASPSSTVRSISRPAVLNAIVTSSSSIFPEIIRRLSGVFPIPRNAQMAAPAAANIMTMIRIRFFISCSSVVGTSPTRISCATTASRLPALVGHALACQRPLAGAFLRTETPSQSLLHALAHRAHRLRQVDPAPVVVVERRRLVVARPLQAALRVGHFHPDGHSGLVPPARLRQLVLRQFQPFLADLHLLLRRAQSIQRQPHIQLDLLLEIAGLHLLRAVLRRRFPPPRISPSAIEQRHAHRDPDGPRRQGIVESRSARPVIAEGRY